MTNPTPPGQVPDALLLADQYAAAHAKWELEDLYGSSKSYTAEKLAERHAARANLERALCPQQPAPAGAPVWQDISTAPKDGTRCVARGHNYGIYSETQHVCIAQWFRGCWMEASDWNETSELKYLTEWAPLPQLADSTPQPTPATPITVEQVEDAIGLQSSAWDTIGAEKIVEAVLRLANAAPATQQARGVEGWLTWFRTPSGGREPNYSHGAKKPTHGAELDAILNKYPVFAAPQPSPTAQAAESVPAIQGEMNVQLDIDSNHSAPGQQRDVARSVALGQPMGNGPNQVAGHLGAQGDKLLTVAERNIRSFLRSAQFKGESDREAALNCVDVLWAAARAPAESAQEEADLPPLPDPDLRDVGTKPQDVKDFLNGYATEYARLALAARAPAESVGRDAAQQPRLTVRLTAFPESNGKQNWTALLVRADKWDGLIGNCGGISLARGELWNRVAYAAECARFLIGERDTEPFILDYGDDIKTPEEWKGEVHGGRKPRDAAHKQGAKHDNP